MFLIACRNLFGDKGRLVITVGGVAFSVILILVLLGLYQGNDNRSIFVIFAIAILMSIIASFIPLKRLVSIDPAQIFKA